MAKLSLKSLLTASKKALQLKPALPESTFDVTPNYKHEFGSKALPEGSLIFLRGAESHWPGEWNHLLNCTAFFAPKYEWDLEEVIQLVQSVSPLPLDTGDLATINSAYNKGIAEHNDSSDGCDAKTQTELYTKDIDSEITLFRTQSNQPFAKLKKCLHPIVVPISSPDFQIFCRKVIWEKRQRSVRRAILDDIISLFHARGSFQAPIEPVNLRVANQGPDVVYATLNSSFAVRIKPGLPGTSSSVTFEKLEDADANFCKPINMLASPEIEFDDFYTLKEKIDLLFRLVNIKSPEDRLLYLAWAVSTLIPNLGAYPILIFQGEHGSGKTSATRITHSLLDNSESILSNIPESERDLAILAQQSWILSFDNISTLGLNLSEALCKMSTGGSFNTRELYTNSGLVTLKVKRPVLINGIDVSPDRADLLDRSIIIQLPTISERLLDEEIKSLFLKNASDILVGVFTVVANVLALRDSIHDYGNFRMADFAKIGCAVEMALGLPKDSFKSAYSSNRLASSALLLEGDSVVSAILQAYKPNQSICTTATRLQRDLLQWVPVEARRYFPQNGVTLSKRLRRLTPELRRHGFTIDFPRQANSRDLILTLPPPQSRFWSSKIPEGFESSPSFTSNTSNSNGKGGSDEFHHKI